LRRNGLVIDLTGMRHVADNPRAGVAERGGGALPADDAHHQIAHAYGPHAARLRAAKARCDPEGVFSATPLPTGA
jgi:hypothetical protein